MPSVPLLLMAPLLARVAGGLRKLSLSGKPGQHSFSVQQQQTIPRALIPAGRRCSSRVGDGQPAFQATGKVDRG
jgi:hypothetical protein